MLRCPLVQCNITRHSQTPRVIRMPLHVALTHKTSYHYDRLVSLGPQTIRLRPAPQARTAILSYDLTVEPQPHFINWMQDPQGNHLARVVFPEKVDRFEVTVDLVADMVTINPFDFFLEPRGGELPVRLRPGAGPGTRAVSARIEPAGPHLTALLAAIPREEKRTVDKLVELNTLIQQRGRVHRPARTGRLHARRKPSTSPRDPAATPPGCWCRCCATSAWRRASCPAT